MKNTATYQGATKEDLEARILYINNTLLNNDMEGWESKELAEVLREYKSQLKCIKEAQKILDTF